MRCFFLGAPIFEPVFALPADRLGYLGANTGNLLIGQSLYAQLDVTYHDGGIRHDPRWIDENFDLLAIPSANFLFRGFDMSYLANVIEQTSLPCLVVGLGAQAPNDSSLDLNLQPGTLRFLKVIGERSVEIGVRGQFTAEAISRLGVKNIRITGCPSLYRSCRSSIKINKLNDIDRPLKIAINGSRDIVLHAGSVEIAVTVQRQLLELAIRHGYPYVLQSEKPEIAIYYSRDPLNAEQEQQISAIRTRLRLATSVSDYVSFVRNQCKVFFDLDSWDRFIRTVDLSIGSRFHGNLIALTNGVPAIFLTHDSRTEELAALIEAPRYRNGQLSQINAESLYHEADYSAFERRYASLYRNYKEFLDRNRVAHKLK